MEKRERGITVICVRSFSIEDKTSDTGTRMVKPGEELVIPRELARSYQDKWIIKVKI